MNTPKDDSKLTTPESGPLEQPGEIPKQDWPIGSLPDASEQNQPDQSQEETEERQVDSSSKKDQNRDEWPSVSWP